MEKLGNISYSRDSLKTIIQETLRPEHVIDTVRVDMDLDNDERYVFDVYLTLNTYENALDHCKHAQFLVIESLTKMCDFQHVVVHIHFENINPLKKEKEQTL